MINEQKIFRKLENLSSKINLCFHSTLFQSVNIQNDPIYKLISTLGEINMILNSNEKSIIKLLYFNFIKIEEKLYDEQEVITIESTTVINELFYYFFLDLLITNNPEIVNYKYEFDLIKNINEQQKKINNNEIFKKILISKIIIELIHNYEEEEENKKEIDNENKIFIENNIKIFNNLNLNWNVDDILKKKLDLIYIEILIALYKFDFNGIIRINNSETLIIQKIDIIKQLDIENIDITKTMFDKLSIELNSVNISNNYNINEFDDLFNDKKIIFFFELFKYILKKSIYVFQIDFLLKTRKNIKKIIKSDRQRFLETYHQKSENIRNNIKYILEFFFEFDYYKKILNLNNEIIDIRNQNNPPIINPLDNIVNGNINIDIDINNNNDINNINRNNIQSFNNINEILKNEENENYGNLNLKVSNPFSRSSVSDAHKSSNRQFEIDKNSKNEENEIEELKEILKKSNFKFNYIENKFNFYEIKFGERNIDININQINEKKLNCQEFILCNSYKQFLKFLGNFEDKIKDKFINNYNLEGELIFEKKDEQDFSKNNNLYNIECKYKFRLPNDDNEYDEFHDENALFKFVNNNNDLEKLDGFLNFLNEINQEEY